MSRYKYSKRAAEFNCKSIEYRESGYYIAEGNSGITYRVEWVSSKHWKVEIVSVHHRDTSLISCLHWIRCNEDKLKSARPFKSEEEVRVEDGTTFEVTYEGFDIDGNSITHNFKAEICAGCSEKLALINHYRKTIRKLVAENKNLKRNYAHLQGVRDGLLLAQGLDERGK